MGHNRNVAGQRLLERNDILIPGLTNDVAVLCLARVPRSFHHIMKGVCRNWENLLNGKVFYKVRRELSLTEEWLYLWVESKSQNVESSWWCCDASLSKWSKLPPVPPDCNRAFKHSGIAVFDEKVFVIGGICWDSRSKKPVPSDIVSYFDPKLNSWNRIANLTLARTQCMASVLNDRLYVFGGLCIDESRAPFPKLKLATSAEVYDPATNTWTFTSNVKFSMLMENAAVMGSKLYATTWKERCCTRRSTRFLKGDVYDLQTDKWTDIPSGLLSGWGAKTTVLNGKLYTVGDFATSDRDGCGIEEHIRVYDPSKDEWELVNSFWDDGPKLDADGGVEFVTVAGKLCIFAMTPVDFSARQNTEIFMALLEVKDSSEKPTYFLTHRDRITDKIHFIETIPSVPRPVMRCQVVAL